LAFSPPFYFSGPTFLIISAHAREDAPFSWLTRLLRYWSCETFPSCGETIWRSTRSRCGLSRESISASWAPNGCGKSTLIKTLTRECYPRVREDSSMRILGREPLECFRITLSAGNCFSGPARGVYHGCDGAGCGSLRFFQQHAHFSQSPAANGTSAARGGSAGATGNRATGNATAGGNVVGRGQAHADRAGACA